jgi:hypothetical protein
MTVPLTGEVRLRGCGRRGTVGSLPIQEASMFRTSRTARRGRAALRWMGEWRLSGPERRAARSERVTERQMRRERDNEQSAAARAAATEAERRRFPEWW